MEVKYIKDRSSKNVKAIIFNNFYYNKFRVNKNSTYYKCREPGCHASVTIKNSGEIKQPVK